MAARHVWMDVDPGHDDATALLLALYCSNIELLGVSTVHGNAPSDHTAVNAARCLHAFGATHDLRVFPGADKPLLVPKKNDPEIHGPDGLGGVDGFLDPSNPNLRSWFATNSEGKSIRALEGMVKTIKETWNNGAGCQVTVISTGPMTNVALFVAAYPELLEAIEEFVFMGGGVGMGNRSAAAEFNIMCDPHAAQIVLDAPVRTVMIPINVSHTAIATKAIRARLLSPGAPDVGNQALPPASTPLRHALSTLVTFFANTYKSTFGFDEGPPLHDALTVAYVSQPKLFRTARKRVDVELTGLHTLGETVVDIWDYRSCDDSWGPLGKNCLVAQHLDVAGFFDLLLTCISRCDEISPLNAA